MSKALQEVYNSYEIDVEAHNGNTEFELLMSANLAANSKKEVSYSFVNEEH